MKNNRDPEDMVIECAGPFQRSKDPKIHGTRGAGCFLKIQRSKDLKICDRGAGCSKSARSRSCGSKRGVGFPEQQR
jgi:hypothetical protein